MVARLRSQFSAGGDIPATRTAEFIRRIRFAKQTARLELLANTSCRRLHQSPNHHHGSRSYRWTAIGDLLRIRLRDFDVFVSQTKRFRPNLAKNRFRTLAKFRTGDEHSHPAILASFHSNNGTEITLPRARKSRAVQKGGNADPLLEVTCLIFTGKILFLCGITGQLERVIKQPAKINGFANYLAGCRGFSWFEEI